IQLSSARPRCNSIIEATGQLTIPETNPRNNPRPTASHHVARGSLIQSANDHPLASSRIFHVLITAFESHAFWESDKKRSTIARIATATLSQIRSVPSIGVYENGQLARSLKPLSF